MNNDDIETIKGQIKTIISTNLNIIDDESEQFRVFSDLSKKYPEFTFDIFKEIIEMFTPIAKKNSKTQKTDDLTDEIYKVSDAEMAGSLIETNEPLAYTEEDLRLGGHPVIPLDFSKKLVKTLCSLMTKKHAYMNKKGEIMFGDFITKDLVSILPNVKISTTSQFVSINNESYYEVKATVFDTFFNRSVEGICVEPMLVWDSNTEQFEKNYKPFEKCHSKAIRNALFKYYFSEKDRLTLLQFYIKTFKMPDKKSKGE